MDLRFEEIDLSMYHSESQKARIKTESWFATKLYCVKCGNDRLEKMKNNSKVCDFVCPMCKSEFELKSMERIPKKNINGAGYNAMIDRIKSNNNPNWFFLQYSKKTNSVVNLIFVSKNFITLNMVEKRKPLQPTARRAGWIGCKILIEKIPEQGKIFIIKDGVVNDKSEVLRIVNRIQQFDIKNLENRGWLIDILNCINTISGDLFDLQDVYAFENHLKSIHPNNNNIREKIRQQLQSLRDKNFIKFLGNGKYQKIR